jgi:hypothetical protein
VQNEHAIQSAGNSRRAGAPQCGYASASPQLISEVAAALACAKLERCVTPK